jgi:hypothetical protein
VFLSSRDLDLSLFPCAHPPLSFHFLPSVTSYRLSPKPGSLDGELDLATECSFQGHVLSLYLAARGDSIAVGDMMKSVTLVQYKQEEGESNTKYHL